MLGCRDGFSHSLWVCPHLGSHAISFGSQFVAGAEKEGLACKAKGHSLA